MLNSGWSDSGCRRVAELPLQCFPSRSARRRPRPVQAEIRNGMPRTRHAAPCGKQQAEMPRQIEVAASVQQRVAGLVDGQRVLAEQFDAERPARIEDVLRQSPAETCVVHAWRGIDDEAAAAVEGPRADAF